MSTQQTTRDKFYTVVAGDTLNAIAARFHTTVKQLQIWNNIPDPNTIEVGQRLVVGKTPVGEPGPEAPSLVPFPGADWFKTLPPPDSPIIQNMGFRLVDEDCGAPYGFSGPGSRWNEKHRKAYALWQESLGLSGPEADGWPGRRSWDALRVPNPTPEQWGSD
ncbi:peptidoglycan-binding protein [Streptomyces inhibens]|uniref:peptidoglycan-binding protein n=1 Tax=Streptomyces inhibens TaxID=2293571 RepID=UPI00402AE49D